jgi:uncharacterized membrane protein YhfC
VLISGAGMMLVAIAFVVYAVVRKLGWGYLGLGALAWVITVALKFAWAIPINTPIYTFLTGSLPKAIAMPIFYVYVGSLTGIFEVGIVWLVLRYTRLGKVDWKKALSFGIGFGVVEAFLLGALSLIGMLTVMLMPSYIPLDALEAAAQSNHPLYAIAPVSERLFTILIHILSNVLIFYAVRAQKPGWFWAAFAYKTAIDSVAAFAQFWGVETPGKIWAVEGVVILFGIIGWLGIRWLANRYPPVEEQAPAPETETAASA